MSALIGALRATLGLDSAAFESGANDIIKRSRKLERSLEQYGKGMTDLGQKMSIAVTLPLVALAKTSVDAAIESKQALAQVETTITSMGNAAGRTADQLSKLAGEQMKKSLYDDDEILRKVTTTLLTFGKVTGKTFDRAQQDAIDLASKFDMDLQSAAMMLGKALNDPVKGITALTRAGVSFTAQQKEQIKAMVAAGDIAGAQSAILKELENQVAGSAAAAAKANPFAALKHSWDDFQEAVGAQVLKILPAITGAIERLLDAFSRMSPGMQQAAVIGGALAAALGPVLMAVGGITQTFAGFIAVLSTIAGEGGILLAIQSGFIGLGAALAPIAAVIAGIAAAGYVLYANWEKIAPALAEFGEQAKAALGPEFKAMVAELSGALTEFWTGPMGEMIRAAISLLGDFIVMNIKTLGPPFIIVVKAAIQTLTALFGMINDGVRLVSSLLKGDWHSAFTAAASLLDRLFLGLPGKIIPILMQLNNAIRTWLVDKLNAVWDMVKARIDAVKQLFFDLYDAVVGHSYIPDMVDGIRDQMDRLDAVMVKPAEKATKKVKDSFKALAEQVAPLLDRLFPEAAAQRAFTADRKLLDKAEQAKVLSAEQAAESRRRLALEGTDMTLADRLAGADEPLGVMDWEQIQRGLSKMTGLHGLWADKAEAANVRVVKSFKEMADDTLAAIDKMVGAIKGGGFLNILSSVISLGLQLGGIGAFGKKIQTNINSAKIPSYAGGTSFHPGGLARVGERGPELVDMPRGSRVWPNGTGPGGGNTYVIKGNLMTPEFWAAIQAGDIMAANNGGRQGLARVKQSQRWALR